MTPRNLLEERKWSGVLYEKSEGQGLIRDQEKRMEELEVERRKPWPVAQEEIKILQTVLTEGEQVQKGPMYR